MPYPETDQDFRSLVASMRELGVLQAFGVTLGPEPTRLQKLEAEGKQRKLTKAEELEVARETLEARIQGARQDMRDALAHNGISYTDEQIDRLLPPEVFE